MTYRDFQRALQIFNLSERATLKEIRTRFRALARKHHPDSSREGDQEMIQDVYAAYRTLLEYCSEYRFCFTQEEFYEQNPEERLRRQFMQEHPWKQDDE